MEYAVDRGLREGCPSSPPLFNIYHHAVVSDFKRRRSKAAQEAGQVPGIEWRSRVDGGLNFRRRARVIKRNIRDEIIGELLFADDTGLVGEPEEVFAATEILLATTQD